MKLQLVRNGIFPITNKNETTGNKTLKTGFSIPGTIQGEGKLAGLPVLFIRTSGCNLRCTWQNDKAEVDICDTAYSSHTITETEEWETEEIIKVLEDNLGNIRHIIISGGEPTLQPIALVRTLKAIKKIPGIHISIETNGTIYVPELAWYVDFFSISPKLRSSDPGSKKNKLLKQPVETKFIKEHIKKRLNIQVIQKYINACMNMESYYGDIPVKPVKRGKKDFQLKFVIASENDEDEIRNQYLSCLGFVEPEDVLLMPLGSTPDLVKKHSRIAAEMAIRNGWRYAPRIHLDLFGNMEGV